MAITYSVSTNIITVTAYTSGTPCNFTDLYNADKAGTLSLHARTGITGVDGSQVAVDRAERPADYIVLGGASNDLYIIVANWNGTTATIRIAGTDRDGTAQAEDIVVTANGTYYTTKWFKTVTHSYVVAANITTFDYDLTQGQWGVVWKECANQFYFTAKLQIGDGSTATWFADTEKQCTWAGNLPTANYQKINTIQANATFRLGTCTNDTTKTTQKGCSMILLSGSYHTVLFHGELSSMVEYYSTNIVDLSSALRVYIKANGLSKVYNCVMDHINFNNYNNTNMYNVRVQRGRDGFYTVTGTFDKLEHTDSTRYGMAIAHSLVSIKNLKIRSASSYEISTNNISGNAYLINPDFDQWRIEWGTTTPTIYRQYEFDLKVIDEDNTPINSAVVKIWDKDDNLVVDTTTNASGVIATQTITRGYYNRANGNTLQDASPHTISIEKGGYTTYEADFTLEEKTDWLIALQIAARQIYVPANTKGVTIV